MKPDYITFGGEKFRVEFNWNATTDFLEAENLTLSDADKFADLKPSQLTAMFFYAVREGQRLDSKEFNLTARDFGAILKFHHIGRFMEIYRKHTDANDGEGAQKKTFFQNLKRFR